MRAYLSIYICMYLGITLFNRLEKLKHYLTTLTSNTHPHPPLTHPQPLRPLQPHSSSSSQLQFSRPSLPPSGATGMHPEPAADNSPQDNYPTLSSHPYPQPSHSDEKHNEHSVNLANFPAQTPNTPNTQHVENGQDLTVPILQRESGRQRDPAAGGPGGITLDSCGSPHGGAQLGHVAPIDELRHSRERWTCLVCTYNNRLSRNKCKMCRCFKTFHPSNPSNVVLYPTNHPYNPDNPNNLTSRDYPPLPLRQQLTGSAPDHVNKPRWSTPILSLSLFLSLSDCLSVCLSIMHLFITNRQQSMYIYIYICICALG